QVLQAAALDVLGGDDGGGDRHLLQVLAAAFRGHADLVEHLAVAAFGIGRGGVLGMHGRGRGSDCEDDGRGQSVVAEQSVGHLAFLPWEQVLMGASWSLAAARTISYT